MQRNVVPGAGRLGFNRQLYGAERELKVLDSLK